MKKTEWMTYVACRCITGEAKTRCIDAPFMKTIYSLIKSKISLPKTTKGKVKSSKQDLSPLVVACGGKGAFPSPDFQTLNEEEPACKNIDNAKHSTGRAVA